METTIEHIFNVGDICWTIGSHNIIGICKHCGSRTEKKSPIYPVEDSISEIIIEQNDDGVSVGYKAFQTGMRTVFKTKEEAQQFCDEVLVSQRTGEKE